MIYRFALPAMIAVAALAATAAAEPAQSARARAAARFKQGQEFFKARDYDHAIVDYEAAYQLSSEPALIFNIGLCHDLAGRPEPALAAFRRYLELAPSGEVADEARRDVARLTPIVETIQARRAAEAAERSEQAGRAETARAAEDAARAAQERARTDAARQVVAQRSAELEHRAQIERWSGLAIGAGGAVALGVGVKFGLDARSAASVITDHRGPWTDSVLARGDGRSAETRMLVFSAIGGAAVVGGGVLYWIGRGNAGEARRMQLGMAAAPSGGFATLSGRF